MLVRLNYFKMQQAKQTIEFVSPKYLPEKAENPRESVSLSKEIKNKFNRINNNK